MRTVAICIFVLCCWGIAVGICVLAARAATTAWRNYREHRKTARDSDRPGTYPGTVFAGTVTGYIQSTSGTLLTARTATGAIAAQWSGTGLDGTDAKEHRLLERDGDLPFLAFKTRGLIWETGEQFGPKLRSLYLGREREGISDPTTAICLNGEHDGPIPVVECSCGFYAMRTVEDLADQRFNPNLGEVLLDVELFGRVIVHEHGYRAERQRILRVGLHGCFYCGHEPEIVGTRISSPFDQVQGSISCVYSFCDDHVRYSDANLTLTLDELSAQLGYPVGWAPWLDIPHRAIGS